MKEREVKRYLEYLGLGFPRPSKKTPIRLPWSKAKATRTNKKQIKK